MGYVPVREEVSAMVPAGEMWRGGFWRVGVSADGGCGVWEGSGWGSEWEWEEGRRLAGCVFGDRVVAGFGVDMEVGLEKGVETGVRWKVLWLC